MCTEAAGRQSYKGNTKEGEAERALEQKYFRFQFSLFCSWANALLLLLLVYAIQLIILRSLIELMLCLSGLIYLHTQKHNRPHAHEIAKKNAAKFAACIVMAK